LRGKNGAVSEIEPTGQLRLTVRPPALTDAA
jgi:hypothetical protein